MNLGGTLSALPEQVNSLLVLVLVLVLGLCQVSSTNTNTGTNTTLLFPGALGDFLCLWPSLQALRDSTPDRIRVFAKPAWLHLLDAQRFESLSIDRHEIADLFASESLKEETRALFAGAARVHSWTGAGDERFAERLALASGAEVLVHRFRAMMDGEHASEYFARCLGVRAVSRLLQPGSEAEEWADDFWSRHALGDGTLAIHPGSGSPTKNWEGMPEVARLWREAHGARVLLVTGPAEEDSATRVSYDAIVHNERLDRVAALLRRAHLYLGNDSGVSHLAGLVGARGAVLFGPSDPRTWRPLAGDLHVFHEPEPCPACGHDRLCVHRASVDVVYASLSRWRETANVTPRTCTPPRAR